MKFMATRFEPDGDYTEIFDAATLADAKRHCKNMGWRLDGFDVLPLKASTPDEADKIVEAMNERGQVIIQ